MDNKLIEVHGLIKDLQVHLVVFPNIQIIMDIVVIDVPDAWGMLFSRKWAVDLGGSIQMNLSYATIVDFKSFRTSTIYFFFSRSDIYII